MRTTSVLSAVLATLTCAIPAMALTVNFDSPVFTGPTAAPGVWYTDRYAPAGFQTASFGGDNRLKHSISASDGANSRPVAFSAGFYNTQGRKFDNAAGTIIQSIDLYVDQDWANTGRRMAGFWGTAVDAANAISAFPIIEFASVDGIPQFRGWDLTGAFVGLGLPTGFTYNTFHTLSIALNANGSFTYLVGDISFTTATTTSKSINNVILQGHNTTEGVNYDIYWDNFSASPIPLPSAAMAGLALLVPLGLTRSRRV